jgi:hypothetical protein
LSFARARLFFEGSENAREIHTAIFLSLHLASVSMNKIANTMGEMAAWYNMDGISLRKAHNTKYRPQDFLQ